MPTHHRTLWCYELGSHGISYATTGKASVATEALDGLIFGLIRLRSSTFMSVQINTKMQVADVNGL
jgi:hypothetical protein